MDHIQFTTLVGNTIIANPIAGALIFVGLGTYIYLKLKRAI